MKLESLKKVVCSDYSSRKYVVATLQRNNVRIRIHGLAVVFEGPDTLVRLLEYLGRVHPEPVSQWDYSDFVKFL